jgi:hypothetical protein
VKDFLPNLEPSDRKEPTAMARRSAGLTLLAPLMLALLTTLPVRAQTLQELAWLEGSWERQGARGVVREVWQRVGPRTFEGEAYRLGDGAREPLEQLLLVELGGEVFYIAKIPENPWPTSFRLVERRQGFARFENPDHDFPQSLVYRLDGRSLKVEVEGQGDGFELHFERID